MTQKLNNYYEMNTYTIKNMTLTVEILNTRETLLYSREKILSDSFIDIRLPESLKKIRKCDWCGKPLPKRHVIHKNIGPDNFSP